MTTETPSMRASRTLQTAPLKAFSTAARTQLRSEVSARLTAVMAPGSQERMERPRAVEGLERAIAAAGGGEEGRASVVDTVSYTWFNRIIALRFMDANGYTGRAIVSPAPGQSGQPEVLALAKRGQIDREVVPPHTADEIIGLLSHSRPPRPGMDAESEAYSLLLTAYCRYWHKAIPAMFEEGPDYTELLLPADVLATTSVMSQAVAVLTPEVCEDVEVIGWLYQFYISERKDEVFAGFKKNKKAGAKEIPPATQLFTPHWIVKYLVENSVGRLWLLNHPDSRLAERMRYYITPVQEQENFLRVQSPEEVTVIDPAAGSGHMLTYAFDLLYDMYEEMGYQPSTIPSLILEKNLVGVEIDPRAGALAAFALTMKAASRQRLFLRHPVKPNITVLEPIRFDDGEIQYLLPQGGNAKKETSFWNRFEHADTFGSLIQTDAETTDRFAAQLETLSRGQHLLDGDVLARAQKVIRQAQVLSRQYSVVVANPPYMGSKQMNSLLSQFMKKTYPTGKADLMAAFMLRAQLLTARGGAWGMINLPSWMSLKSFEQLRVDLLHQQRISSLVHLGRGVFGSDFGSVAFVADNESPDKAVGVYRRLFEHHVDVRSVETIKHLFLDPEYNRYVVPQSDLGRIPGSPLAYWLSEKMRSAFTSNWTLSSVAELAVGLQTSDNPRFVRLWWEVSKGRSAYRCTSREDSVASGARWFPYNKGGEFRKWYGNQEYVVNWENDGEELFAFRPKSVIRNPHTYFSPSVSWSDVSSGEAAFRHYPKGFIHDSTGHSLFGAEGLQLELLAILNSSIARHFLGILSPTLHFHIGYVGQVPIPSPQPKIDPTNVQMLLRVSQIDYERQEISPSFQGSPLVAFANLK